MKNPRNYSNRTSSSHGKLNRLLSYCCRQKGDILRRAQSALEKHLCNTSECHNRHLFICFLIFSFPFSSFHFLYTEKKKYIYIYMHTKLLESSLTLCNLMDCSLHGSSVHEVLQARILECIAMLSSKGSSQPRDRTHISYASCIGRQVLYHWHHLGSPYIIISYIEFTH